jgi:prepilin-type processing-associated H-X9-DG protein
LVRLNLGAIIVPILVTCECGKQFQVQDENVGRRFSCPDCGRELVVPKAAGEVDHAPLIDRVEAKTSGKAITSLVLGILSLFCSFFTGLPAIILGAIGLSEIGKSKGRLQGHGLAITGIVFGSVGSLLSIVGILVGLLLPAVSAARESARRLQCISNLRQVGLGLMSYTSQYNHYPTSAIVDAEGKPLLSWRVAILPYIDQVELYKEFKLDEPWDGPNNIKLLDRMPRIYRCPSGPKANTTMTYYQVVVGPGTMFDGQRLIGPSMIRDGSSTTILAVEATNPVEWSKPDDIDLAQITGALGGLHRGGYNVLFADGAVKFLDQEISESLLHSLLTRDGREVIPPGALDY